MILDAQTLSRLAGVKLRARAVMEGVLSGLHKTQPEALIDSVGRARQNLRRTAPSVEEFISTIEAQGLVDFASILRRQKIRLSGKPISRP